MKAEQIDRINYLARKSREEGLSADEKKEQSELRAAYIAAFRGDLESQLDSITVVEPDGTKHKLKKTEKPRVLH